MASNKNIGLVIEIGCIDEAIPHLKVARKMLKKNNAEHAYPKIKEAKRLIDHVFGRLKHYEDA